MPFNVTTLLLISLLHIDTTTYGASGIVLDMDSSFQRVKCERFLNIFYFTEIHLSSFMSCIIAMNLMIPLKVKYIQSSPLWC